MLTQWAKPRRVGGTMPPYARDEIIHHRRLLLVHSCIYYVLNAHVVEDHVWQQWAFELAYLQDDYGDVVGFYDEAFAGWDGSSGYFLPGVSDPDIMRVARRTLRYAIGGSQ